MSFFDDTKILGLVLIVVGILKLLGAIITIAAGFVDLGVTVEGISNLMIYCVVAGLGELIAGFLYLGVAFKVRSGAISSKIDVLASYVKIVGLTFIVSGIFTAIAAGVASDDIVVGIIGAAIASVIIVIIGLIILLVGAKINDGKQTFGDKIIWIILLLAFIIMLFVNLLGLFGGLTGIIPAIAGILISLFMLGFLFDSEVKNGMGI